MTLPTKLPYASGSIQKRRRTWWMIYRDRDNCVRQENSHTTDQAAALRLLARRALATWPARLEVLREIARGATQAQAGTGGLNQTLGSDDVHPRQPTRDRALPKNAPSRARGTRRTGGKAA